MPIPAPPAPTTGPLTYDELQLALRNRGLLLEALRYDITPVGLHYLLVHFDIPWVDAATWSLELGGAVARPLRLTLADLQARPSRTVAVTIECAGNGRARLDPRPISQPWLCEAVSTAEWTGTPLAPLLAEAGLADDAVDLVFTGADHGVEKGYEHDYARSLTPADALRDEVMLAYAMNGHPIEPQHGAPVRLVAPGWYGMMHVKWLRRIDALRARFDGYQQAVAYWYRAYPGDPGEPVTRMRPRALMIPPGFPDWLTRHRVVERGAVAIRGRAWSGTTAIDRVEFGVDGAWHEATLGAPVGPHAWRSWTCTWDAALGDHELACRVPGQPDEPPWNLQGMGNNAIQRVPVVVR
jgi:DMSO/TMAO reductase YedYZ molybdopterin-dependent catalytic subunit